MRSPLIPALAALALLCGGAGAARAHAVLLHSVPADGAVLDAAPGVVAFHFSEPVRPISVRVLDATGADLAAGAEVVGRDDAMHITLPGDLPRGSYLVSYRVTSLDLHPVGGSFAFAVGAPLDAAALREAAEGERWWPAAMLARFGVYAGLAGGAGGALFLLLVAGRSPTPPGRRFVAACAGLGAAAALLSVGVHGAHLANAPYAAILAPGLWAGELAGRFGASALLTAAGLALVAAACRRPERAANRAALGLGALAALAGLPVAGHVTAAGPAWLTVPALFAHGLAIAFWLGALAPLLLHVAREGRGALALVERFSRLAVPAVAVLVLAGAVLAALQVREPEALLATGYGRILLLKLAAVGLLLALAAGNRLVLTPALRAGTVRAPAWLRRTIAAEVAGAGVILAATAGLGLATPPRALAGPEAAGAAPAGYTTEVAANGYTVRVEVVPAQPGPNDVRVTVTDPNGAPVRPLEVQVGLTQPEAGIEPLERDAAAAGETYEVAGLVLPVAGVWRVQVDALITDFEKVAVAADAHVH